MFQYHELVGIADLHLAYIGPALRHELAKALLCYVLLCCAVLNGLLSHDEISFELHSLDWPVSARFLLIAWLSRLATESLNWRVWRD